MTFKTTPTQRNWLNQVDSSIMSHEIIVPNKQFPPDIANICAAVSIHHVRTKVKGSVFSIAETFSGQNSTYSASMNVIAKPHLRRKTTLGNFHAFEENL